MSINVKLQIGKSSKNRAD